MHDLYSNVQALVSLTIAARTATATGTAVDLARNGSAFQSALVIVQTGTITDGTHTVSVEHSDDNSSWSAAAASDLQGTAPAIVAANDDTFYELGYLGGKRYIRVKSTVSGASSGGTYGALIVLGDPKSSPVVRP